MALAFATPKSYPVTRLFRCTSYRTVRTGTVYVYVVPVPLRTGTVGYGYVLTLLPYPNPTTLRTVP